MNYRLIYKSRVEGISITKDTLRDVLYESFSENQASEVRGALLATRTHFLQVLEGGFAEINETFYRIARDERHTELQLVSFRPADFPLFSSWRMKGIGVFDLNTEIEERLKDRYGEEEGGVRMPVDEQNALFLVHDMEMIEALQVDF